jgi:hypothetical protein
MEGDLEAACRRLAHSFCVLSDRSDFAALTQLFTEDGVFERGQIRAEGHAELVATLAARSTEIVTRHLITTSLITSLPDGSAEGCHYCLVFVKGGSFDPSQPIVREYQDSYRRTALGWKIQSRQVLTPFAS